MRLDELHMKILEGLSEKDRLDFEAGLRNLNMESPADRMALRESIKRLRPDFSEAQLDLFIEVEVKSDADWIA